VEAAGWTTRGHGQFKSLEGVVGHHTGTPDTAPGDYPSLRIVRDGRSDLPGPLCNYGLGRSGTVYVVAAGVAWHAGASSFAGFTNLNTTFLGIEAESAGGGRWTPAQLDAYPRLVAACLRAMGRGADRYVSHRTCATPAGRKPDPTGIEDSWMRARVAALLGTTGGDDMAQVPQDEWNRVRDAILAARDMWGGGTGERLSGEGMWMRSNVETRRAWEETKAARTDLLKVQAMLTEIGARLTALEQK
jgi:hypothetical protein